MPTLPLRDADRVPFEPKERGPDADEAVKLAVKYDQELRAHDILRRGRVNARAEAISIARTNGVTLRELAEALGVSPERVRQMEAGK